MRISRVVLQSGEQSRWNIECTRNACQLYPDTATSRSGPRAVKVGAAALEIVVSVHASLDAWANISPFTRLSTTPPRQVHRPAPTAAHALVLLRGCVPAGAAVRGLEAAQAALWGRSDGRPAYMERAPQHATRQGEWGVDAARDAPEEAARDIAEYFSRTG